eukprot:GHVU01122753.1.p2 GENE.GHVU01122753.1~~GHVU01122753.1.p2  ORF type:complete len:151 (+),score=9.39 GHVU01122753.1:380-832(+)
MFEAAGLMEKAAIIAEETGTTIENYSPGSTTYLGTYHGEVTATNKPQGLGVIRYPNNVFYAGTWLNGNYHGLGVYRYSSGNIEYAGQWQSNTHHGLGTNMSVRCTLHHRVPSTGRMPRTCTRTPTLAHTANQLTGAHPHTSPSVGVVGGG